MSFVQEAPAFSPSHRAPVPEPLLLVEEISHRVVNEYSQAAALLRLAAADDPHSGARRALGTAADRLCDFAEVHRALQPPLSRDQVDLGQHIKELLAATTKARLGPLGIQLSFVAEPVPMSPERCWRVALIVSELVTNAVRHGLRGASGSISVEIGTAGGLVHCLVADDGCSAACAKPGRGLGIVRCLAEQLGGTVTPRLGGRGSSIAVVFPVQPEGRLA